MLAREATAAAEDWVRAHAHELPGYGGAYRVGSAAELSDDAEVPLGSDVDILVATDADAPKPGKFRHRGVLLEVSFVPWSALDAAETDYHLAHGLRRDTIIDDPTGRLRSVQTRVARHFDDPDFVRRRCASAVANIHRFLENIDVDAPFHRQAMGWLFGTGVTTHVLLVAARRNPTVRLRYLRARDLVPAGDYERLLVLLGAAGLSGKDVAGMVDALERTFDATVPVARTTSDRFGSNVSPSARPIAIDAARALIQRGDHREAVFWILATFGHCHGILAADAPALHEELLPAYRGALGMLGIEDHADMMRRAASVIGSLPGLDRLAEQLIQASPAIIR